MPFRGEIPEALTRSIIEGNCVAFVGSGLSMGVRRSNGNPLPSWPRLLKEIIEYAERENVPLGDVKADMNSAIEEGELLTVAQELQDRLSPESLARCLREIFLDSALRPGDFHRHLVAIPFRGFLTTNYDVLIEGAYTLKSQGVVPPTLIQEDLRKVPNPLRLGRPFVFKMHGDINRVESVILGSHDYQDTMFRMPHYRSFLETVFTVNTVLFLGFGVRDPDIINALDRLAAIYARTNDYHYALLEKGRFSGLQKRRLALDKRIKIIEYENDDGTHGQVLCFLELLDSVTTPYQTE